MAKRRHPLKGVDRDQLHAENVEKTIAVNDMYIDAIHAKLRLLESIWKHLLNLLFIDKN